VVRFSTEERLNEMIDYCREIGVSVANPHVNNVEGGGRYRSDNVQLLAKYRYDTKGLLNPGKMVTFEKAPPEPPSHEELDSGQPQLRLSHLEAGRRSSPGDDASGTAHGGHRAAWPHLPLATDTLINSILLGAALARCRRRYPVYALPAVCYGKSNEHIGFPGTLSVSSSTFMAVLRDLGASIAASGFKKLVLYNTHGGNSSLVDVMARDLRAEFGLRVFSLFGSGGAAFTGLGDQERAYGFHAGEVETSFLLSAIPELVHTGEYTVNYIADIAKTRVAASGECARDLRLAHPRHCAQRSDGRSQSRHGGEGHALD
jgi:creatinine amidohydrolase/Fe(II)-dependent formamide hydrolase-like protein